MMDEAKLSRILKSMEEHDVPQLIMSDPLAIYYLLGKKFAPGERMLVLYLNVNGNHKLVINELFPQDEDLGVELVWYSDIQDGVEILSQFVEKDKIVGVDKVWPSKFLLRLQELGAGSKFVNGSLIVDYVRMIKDEHEQELMRKASLENDKIMEQLIPLVVKGYTELELNAIVRDMYKKSGHSDVSFDPITCYGKSGADPHHVTNDTKGKRGDSVVLDIGGVLDNYCSDMTRTVFIGEVSDRAREVYEIVKEAQRRGLEAASQATECVMWTLRAEIILKKKDLASILHTERVILSVWRITNLAMYLLSMRILFRLASAFLWNRAFIFRMKRSASVSKTS